MGYSIKRYGIKWDPLCIKVESQTNFTEPLGNNYDYKKAKRREQ